MDIPVEPLDFGKPLREERISKLNGDLKCKWCNTLFLLGVFCFALPTIARYHIRRLRGYSRHDETDSR